MSPTATATPTPETAATPKARPSSLAAAMDQLDPPSKVAGYSRADLDAAGSKVLGALKNVVVVMKDAAVNAGSWLKRNIVGRTAVALTNAWRSFQDDTRDSWNRKNEQVADKNLGQAGDLAIKLSGTSTAAGSALAKLNASFGVAVETVTKAFASAKTAKHDEAKVGDDGRAKTELTMRVLTVAKEASQLALKGAKASAVLFADTAAVDAAEANLVRLGVSGEKATALVASMRKRNADAGGAVLAGLPAEGLDNPATAQALLEVAGQLSERAARNAASANAVELKKLKGLMDGITQLNTTTVAVRTAVGTLNVGDDLQPAKFAEDVRVAATAAAVEKLGAGDFAGVQAVVSEADAKLGAVRALHKDKLAPLAAALASGADTVLNTAIEAADSPDPRNPGRTLTAAVASLRETGLQAFAEGRTQDANKAFADAMKVAGTLRAMAASVAKAVEETKALTNVTPDDLKKYFAAAARHAATLMPTAVPSDRELALAHAAFSKAMSNLPLVARTINDARAKLTTPGVDVGVERSTLEAAIGVYETNVTNAFGREFDAKKLSNYTSTFNRDFDKHVKQAVENQLRGVNLRNVVEI